MGNIADIYGGEAFDPSQHEQQQSYDPLPPGWYPVQIVDAEVKDTKAGNGKRLSIRMEVLSEEHNGRMVFHNFNLVNPNPQAVEIGQRELATMVAALGLVTCSDTDELLGKQAMCRLKVSKPKEGYEPDNAVAAWKPMDGGDAAPPAKASPTPAAAPAASTAAPAPAASGGGKRPWER